MRKLLFSFDGRINRATFWAGISSMVIVQGLIWTIFSGPSLIYLMADFAGRYAGGLLTIGVVALIALGTLTWIICAITAKRWHDRDKSAAWILISLIPFIGWVWHAVECGLLRGTVGSNKYGPAPKEPVHPIATALSQLAVSRVTRRIGLPVLSGVSPPLGASFMGYCPGCRKPRSSAVRKCTSCGNTDPVPSFRQPSEVAYKYGRTPTDIEREIDELGRALEGRYRSAGPESPKNGGGGHSSPNHSG